MCLKWSWMILRNHEIRLRDDVSAHQNDGSEAFSLCWRTMVHHMKWCEALSSSQVPLREPKWSDGQVTPNDPQHGLFRGNQLSESKLDHQIFNGGKSNHYLGKFSSWFWLHRRILSLRTGWNPDFNSMKRWIFSHIRINIGTFQASPGIIRDH